MYVEFLYDLLPLVVLIPGFLLVIFFIVYARQLQLKVQIFSLLLLMVLMQPAVTVFSSAKNERGALFIDTGYSMQLVDRSLRKQAIEATKQHRAVDPERVFTLGQRPLSGLSTDEILSLPPEAAIKPDIKPGSMILAGPRSLSYSRDPGIFVSTIHIEKPDFAIGNVELPVACYSKEPCEISATVMASRNTELALIAAESEAVLSKVHVAKASQPTRVTMRYIVPAQMPAGNITARLVIGDSTSQENRQQNPQTSFLTQVPVLLAIQKGLPRGYFYLPRADIINWRISYLLSEFHGIEVDVYSDMKHLNLNKYSFTGSRVTSIEQAKGTALPDFFIMSSEMSRYPGFTRISDRWYGRGNDRLLVLSTDSSSDNIFFDVSKFTESLNDFTELIQAETAAFYGAVISSGSPAFVNAAAKSIPEKLLLNDKEYFLQKDIGDRDMYLPDTMGSYKTPDDKTAFVADIPADERAGLPFAGGEPVDSNIQMQQLEQKLAAFESYIKQNPAELTSEIYLTASFMPQKSTGGTGVFMQYIFYIIFALVFLYVFNLNIYRKKDT